MADIQLTVKQIMNLGLWQKVCEYKGWSEWIYNEGRIGYDEWVTFDDEFKKPEEVEPMKVGDQYSRKNYNYTVVGVVTHKFTGKPIYMIEQREYCPGILRYEMPGSEEVSYYIQEHEFGSGYSYEGNYAPDGY
jgi:hypothetical protein